MNMTIRSPRILRCVRENRRCCLIAASYGTCRSPFTETVLEIFPLLRGPLLVKGAMVDSSGNLSDAKHRDSVPTANSYHKYKNSQLFTEARQMVALITNYLIPQSVNGQSG